MQHCLTVMGNHTSILLYDDCCNLCSRVVRFVRRFDWEGRIELLPLQSERAGRLIDVCKLKADGDSVVFITRSNCYIRSDAALMVFRVLGGGWRLFVVFRLVPRLIRDRIYNLIAFNRYRLFGHSCGS